MVSVPYIALYKPVTSSSTGFPHLCLDFGKDQIRSVGVEHGINQASFPAELCKAV
jgi:hypothetical protein